MAQVVARYLGVVEAVGSSPVTPTSRKVRKWRKYAVCGLFFFAWSLPGTCQNQAQDTMRTLLGHCALKRARAGGFLPPGFAALVLLTP